MPELLQIPFTDRFIEVLVTAPDAPRREEGWTHEFEPPNRWGYGVVYRLVGRLAVMLGTLEPEPIPRDMLGQEGTRLRLIGEEEIDTVRANLDERNLSLIQRGYRPWYADIRDRVMYEVESRRMRVQAYPTLARERVAQWLSR